MNVSEFEAAVSRTRLQTRSIQVARRHFVSGLSVLEAAREVGVSQQAAYRAVARVAQELRRPEEQDLVIVTAAIPKEMHEALASLVRKVGGRMVGSS